PFTVQANATLNVGNGVSVLIRDAQNLTVTGAMNVTAPASFAIEDLNDGFATGGIVVNGTLSFSGTTLSRAGGSDGSDNTRIQVNSGGELSASNSTFTWNNLVLAAGSKLTGTDLSNDTFATTLSVPAVDIPLLSNNQSFQDIDINANDSLPSGQTATLSQIGTVSTANLRYVFPGPFTVQANATLNVGNGVSVLI